MDKIFVRFTIVITSLYFVISYIVAQLGVADILSDWYVTLFESCVVLSTFNSGKFHCKYIRFTALALLISDVLTRVDNTYNFLSVDAHNLIPIGILAIGIGTSLTLAIKHFYKVNKLKYGKRKNRINYG